MNKKLINHLLTCLAILFCVGMYGQQKTVTGVVTDANGLVLPGTSIVVKGTVVGVQTDFDGNYSIDANTGDVLVFSYIGYKNSEITIRADSVINVVLKEDSSVLDEVVVIGYNSQNKNTLATAVSKLDNKNLESVSRSNAATALQGTVAGVAVTNNTGQPGSTPSVVIRGGTSYNGTGSPLILVDGVSSSFYGLNPNDIESMVVLKDAASTAIYGARAADGVVLITTKKGKVGKANINFSSKYSTNYKRETPTYVGAADFIKYNRQGVAYYTEATGKTNFDNGFLHGATAFGTGGNATNSPYSTQFLNDSNRYLLDQQGWSTVVDPVTGQDILFRENDVSDLIYQDSHALDNYLSFDGGNEKGTFFLGLGGLDNDGLILGSGFKRYTGKLSASYEVANNVKVNSTINYTHSNLNRSPLGSDNTVFQRFSGQALTSRTYNNNEDGTLSDELNPGTNHGFGNPLYYQDKFRSKNLEQRLSAIVGLDWQILEELKLSVSGSYFTINNYNESFNRAYLSGGSLKTGREASIWGRRTLRNQYTAMLNYIKTVKGKHNFNAILGAEYYKDNYFRYSAGTRNSPTDLIETLNAGSEANGIPSSYESEHVISSLFGQLNYDFESKYLVGVTFRYDGSSRLANDKFGFFPGVSTGWNAHNEEFYMNSGVPNVMSKFKPRVSYGVNGSVRTLGGDEDDQNYGVFGSYGIQGVYNGQSGYVNTALPTLDLTWERSTTLNFGVDIGFLDDKITLIADYFVRDVNDKISNLTLPYWTGFSSIQNNNGTLRNKGFELQINATAIQNDKWKWDLGATLYHVKNYVVALPDNDNEFNRQGGEQIYDSATGGLKWVGGLQEGQRVGLDEVYTYVQEYIYADQAEVDAHVSREDVFLSNRFQRFPGDVAWKDVNGDNVIDSEDREFVGRTTPDFVGGFTSNLTYQGFNLFIKTDFATGHVIANNMRIKGLAQTQGNLNAFDELLDSWTPTNTDTDVPRMVFVDAQKNFYRGAVNSRYWEKGDYLALREVTLSYNFDSELFNDKIDALRLFLTGDNIAYLKGYSGDTPEIGGFQGGRFPMPKTFTMGLNLTF